MIHPWKMGGNRRGYATAPQPIEEVDTQDGPRSKREEILSLLEGGTGLTSQEIAECCGVSKRYVNAIRRESRQVGTKGGKS